ncbi:hypothetical protein GCM10010198_43980 [Nocardia seriolae]|nr:hypothetical protein NSERKGN1266_60780 [Nocardia seriolae]BEK94042.1 hypothetical protein NSER024013_19480 [Nocardia seriolae]
MHGTIRAAISGPAYWSRSLRILHPELIESDSKRQSGSDTPSTLDAPTTANYLEKIFQLSYTLPPMTLEGVNPLEVWRLLYAASSRDRAAAEAARTAAMWVS